MPRPRQQSIIQIPPRVRGFIPLGYYADENEPILLNLEEFEAIRLLDYENQSQAEAAVIMKISRPTLTRIYLRARKKIAAALVESHQLLLEGGTAIYEGEWYSCEKCENKFNNPQEEAMKQCPLCAHNGIKQLIGT